MNFDAANSLKRCSSAPIIANPQQQIHRATPSILARPMNTTNNHNSIINSTNSNTNVTASRSR